jgi:hypothetical protein
MGWLTLLLQSLAAAQSAQASKQDHEAQRTGGYGHRRCDRPPDSHEGGSEQSKAKRDQHHDARRLTHPAIHLRLQARANRTEPLAKWGGYGQRDQSARAPRGGPPAVLIAAGRPSATAAGRMDPLAPRCERSALIGWFNGVEGRRRLARHAQAHCRR